MFSSPVPGSGIDFNPSICARFGLYDIHFLSNAYLQTVQINQRQSGELLPVGPPRDDFTRRAGRKARNSASELRSWSSSATLRQLLG
jgi:hypothetical protein